LASQPARGGWLGGTTFSTAAHGALIALAVASTGSTFSSVQERRAASPERITYVVTRRLEPAPPARTQRADAERSAAAPPTLATDAVMPDLTAVQDAVSKAIQIPDAVPNLSDITNAWLSREDDLSHAGTSVAGLMLARTGYVRPENGIYTESMVERSVEPRHGNPTPNYPRILQDMGIEGDFVVKYVVDSTGVVMEDRIEFPSAMHRLFAEAVRAALRRSRYNPASIAGARVPQMVIQEFRFTIGRR
jgi:TonB family protein